MRKLMWLLPVLVVAFIFASQAESKSKPKTRAFTLLNIQYEGSKIWVPGTMIVKKGDTVKLKLINKAPSGVHGFAINAYGIKVLVPNDGKAVEVEFVAKKSGLFQTYCHQHSAHIGGQLLVLKR